MLILVYKFLNSTENYKWKEDNFPICTIRCARKSLVSPELSLSWTRRTMRMMWTLRWWRRPTRTSWIRYVCRRMNRFSIIRNNLKKTPKVRRQKWKRSWKNSRKKSQAKKGTLAKCLMNIRRHKNSIIIRLRRKLRCLRPCWYYPL